MMWYLKERNYLRQDERGDYEITGPGVDYVEEHIPTNRILYKLCKGGRERHHAYGVEFQLENETYNFMTLPPLGIWLT